jgi:hypothetical protein
MRSPAFTTAALASVKGNPTTGGTATVGRGGATPRPPACICGIGIRGKTKIYITKVVPIDTIKAVKKATKKVLS